MWKFHSIGLQNSAQPSVIFAPSSHDKSQLQCSSRSNLSPEVQFVCLFFISVCILLPEMFAEPTGICLSFLGCCFFCFFICFFPVRYLMRCYLTGARGHQWGCYLGGGVLSCGYADTSLRCVYIIGFGSAVRVAPAPSGFILYVCVCHRNTKNKNIFVFLVMETTQK